MAKTIWKYPIRIVDQQVLELPVGAEPLSVAMQHGDACLWALVDPQPELKKKQVTVFVRGTGHPMGPAEGARFIGTVLMLRGDLVFHIFVKDGVDYY